MHYSLFITIILLACNIGNEQEKEQNKEEESPEVKIEITSDQLIKVWKLVEIDIRKNRPDITEKQRKSLEARHVSKGHLLTLYPLSVSGLLVESYYSVHAWEYDAESKHIVLKTGASNIKLENVEMTKKGSDHYLSLDDDLLGRLKFIAYSDSRENYKTDPFYPGNNEWRLKAENGEDDRQLKLRVLNLIQHYAYLFKASIDDPDKTFTNRFSKSIINVYKGGIGLVKKSQITEDWIGTFYNEEQGLKAYDFLKKYMKNRALKKEVVDDWKQTNYELLTELKAKIEADLEI